MQSSPMLHTAYHGHSDILFLAKILGYEINEAGMCSGISTMAMQAILAKDIDTLENRIDFISDLVTTTLNKQELDYTKSSIAYLNLLDALKKPENKKALGHVLEKLKAALDHTIDELTDDVIQQWFEIEPFFDGIALHQEIEKNAAFKIGPAQGQHFRHALSLTTPVALDKTGIHEFDHLCYSFTENELNDFLHKMKDEVFSLGNGAKSIIIAGSVASGAGGHAITIGYDPELKEWYLKDSNKPLLRTRDIGEINHYIFDLYQHKNHVNLNMDFYGLKTEKELLEEPFNKIKQSLIDSLKYQRGKLNQLDSRGYSLLLHAVQAQYADWVKLFLDLAKSGPKAQMGANDTDKNGVTVFAYALFTQNVEIIKILLDHGADPNKRTSADISLNNYPLLYAINSLNINVVELLIGYGANPNLVMTADEQSIMHIAALICSKQDRLDILKQLIQHGGDIDLLSQHSISPLDMITKPADRQALMIFTEKYAENLLKVFKHHIATTNWQVSGALGMQGGETIKPDQQTSITVPENTKKQWDEIILAEQGQKSFRDALKQFITIGKEVKPNTYRSPMTNQYYSLFKENDPQKIWGNLNANSAPAGKKALKK